MYQNIFMLQNILKTKHKKQNYFTKEEDASLTQLVNQYGTNDFKKIAKQMPNRNVRQCRERWQHFLNPNINKSEATEEEDKIIIEKYKEIGPKWKIIAKYLKNRTPRWVRSQFNFLNRYNSKKQTNNHQIQVQNQVQNNNVPINYTNIPVANNPMNYPYHIPSQFNNFNMPNYTNMSMSMAIRPANYFYHMPPNLTILVVQIKHNLKFKY